MLCAYVQNLFRACSVHLYITYFCAYSAPYIPKTFSPLRRAPIYVKICVRLYMSKLFALHRAYMHCKILHLPAPYISKKIAFLSHLCTLQNCHHSECLSKAIHACATCPQPYKILRLQRAPIYDTTFRTYGARLYLQKLFRVCSVNLCTLYILAPTSRTYISKTFLPLQRVRIYVTKFVCAYMFKMF